MDTMIATASDFRLALLATRDSRDTKPAVWDLWVRLLVTHYKMPGRTISAAQLAGADRALSRSSALLNYNKLAQAVAKQIGYCPPSRDYGKRDPMWWMALSAGTEQGERDEQFQLSMHSELAEALERMGWVQPPPA